jgi:hypothetical protein
LINSVLITAFINIVINTGAAAAGARGHHVAWWTSNPFKTNLLYNTLGTLFILPLVTALGVGSAVAKERGTGMLAPIGSPFNTRPWRWVRSATGMRRALRIAVVTFVALAPLDIAVVVIFGRNGADASHFVMVQVLFAVLLGAVVTPLVALVAMCDEGASA